MAYESCVIVVCASMHKLHVCMTMCLTVVRVQGAWLHCPCIYAMWVRHGAAAEGGRYTVAPSRRSSAARAASRAYRR